MTETTATTTPATTASTLTAGTWTVEPIHSEVGFSVRHLGLSKVRGRFNSFGGTLTIGADGTASVEASVDMSSVDTNNSDRDAHLRSTDFFDAEHHPQMTFRSTNVSDHTLDGDLTINGVTRAVGFDLEFHGVAVDGYGTTRAGFSATARIQRSDFGIDFNAPLGVDGMLIGDAIDISLEIQAVPNA